MATNSETLAGLICDKIAGVSDFTGWTIGIRRKEEALGISKFPAILIVAMEPEELSIDTDNRSEIGYGYGIILAYKDEVGLATDANQLPDWQRLAQQAVYHTDYAGFLVEDVEVRPSTGLDLKGLKENCLVSDFYLMLSVLEDRYT
ncbi:MAG: hypothetical protein N2112_02485 [Gemmataceae bacterium]|nr:hypothetical protein [Gemmataceae bacterium]